MTQSTGGANISLNAFITKKNILNTTAIQAMLTVLQKMSSSWNLEVNATFVSCVIIIIYISQCRAACLFETENDV